MVTAAKNYQQIFYRHNAIILELTLMNVQISPGENFSTQTGPEEAELQLLPHIMFNNCITIN
jgi:hypothetical protein